MPEDKLHLHKELENKLARHDFWYMMSDDNRAYTQGNESLKEIRKLAEDLKLSPEYWKKLWNSYAPEGQKING